MPRQWPPASCKIEFFAFYASAEDLVTHDPVTMGPRYFVIVLQPVADAAPFAFVTVDLRDDQVIIEPYTYDETDPQQQAGGVWGRDGFSDEAEQALIEAIHRGKAPRPSDPLYAAYRKELKHRLPQTMSTWPRYRDFFRVLFPKDADPYIERSGPKYWNEQWTAF